MQRLVYSRNLKSSYLVCPTCVDFVWQRKVFHFECCELLTNAAVDNGALIEFAWQWEPEHNLGVFFFEKVDNVEVWNGVFWQTAWLVPDGFEQLHQRRHSD